jgi:hypothetical protein
MIQTIEAMIDQNGHVSLLEPVQLQGIRRALVTILEEQPIIQLSEAIGADHDVIEQQPETDESEWLLHSFQALSAAYAADEPDYPVSLIREWNPEYERG